VFSHICLSQTEHTINFHLQNYHGSHPEKFTQKLNYIDLDLYKSWVALTHSICISNNSIFVHDSYSLICYSQPSTKEIRKTALRFAT
jgi:hypothetical protein